MAFLGSFAEPCLRSFKIDGRTQTLLRYGSHHGHGAGIFSSGQRLCHGAGFWIFFVFKQRNSFLETAGRGGSLIFQRLLLG